MASSQDDSDRLCRAIVKATNKNELNLDPESLKEIKQLCKSTSNNVYIAVKALRERLKEPHSQVRLNALRICIELFKRSQLFRKQLSSQFPTFLENVIGHKTELPLPAPSSSAVTLRSEALAAIESWSTEYGSRYPQILMGYDYLKNKLKFRFPEVDSRAALREAMERERQERVQRAAMERYTQLQQEWNECMVEYTGIVAQMKECFALLQEKNSSGGDEDDDLEWEDIDQHQDNTDCDQQGILEYQAGPSTGQSPQRKTHRQDDDDDNDDVGSTVVLLEHAYSLHKLISNRALGKIQGWLRTLVEVEVGQPGEAGYARKERYLREATALKSDLVAVKERFEALGLDLAALAQRQHAKLRSSDKGKDAAAIGGKFEDIMNDLFGSSDDDDDDDDDDDMKGGRRGHDRRHHHKRTERKVPHVTTAAAAVLPREPSPPNPYDSIKDPAAPRPVALKSPNNNSNNNSNSKPATRPPSSSSSSLPEEVKRRLAAAAPVLPGGAYTRYWDSSCQAPQYVSGHGLEVSNHWGPVNVHQELPKERMDELFMYAPPPSEQQGDNNNKESTNPPAPPPSSAQQQQQQQQKPKSLTTANTLGLLSHDRKAQRQRERAYNDAIISGRISDSNLARQLAERSNGDVLIDDMLLRQQQQAGGGGNPPSSSSSKRKKKDNGSVRDRLRRKLLSGKAARAAINDCLAADDETIRDKFGANKWDNK